MPRQFTLLILSVFLFSGMLRAEHVDETKAKKAALNHYRHYAPATKRQASIAKVKEYKWGGRTSFYICSFDKGGFVLVSANDQVTPVLGYGFEHGVPDDITNEAVKAWFDSYARQIDTVFVLNLKNDDMAAKWQDVLEDKLPAKNSNSVEPLLTTTWGQGWPYNAMCPEDVAGPGGHVWAGCVATAMAQILKYHNYPEQGLGSYGYQIPWLTQYPYTFADFGATNYNWANMPDSLSAENSDIAILIYQTAVSCSSIWGSSSTGVQFSSTENPFTYAFINFFKMSFSSIRFVERQDFIDTTWDSIIQQELTANRPVYYRGDSVGSHAFVCDGFDEINMFHFNWGWDGIFNGFYSLSNLNPGFGNFSNDQMAIIGIKPNEGSTLVENTIWSGEVIINTPLAIPVAITLTVEQGTTVKFAQNCMLQIYGKLTSIGTEANYIKYTAIDTTLGWHGIKLDNNYLAGRVKTDSDDISKLIYSQVEYSKLHGVDCKFAELLIDHCKINNNHANGPWSRIWVRNDFMGAGIFVLGYPIKISNSMIYNNHATDEGGGITYLQMDSIASIDHPNEIYHNEIFNNEAGGFGGGVDFIVANNIIVKENIIHHNQSMNGAGLATNFSSVKIENNAFYNNTATGWVGGTIAHYYESMNIIVGNLISNNAASGISLFRSNCITLNNTIVNNNSGMWFWHNSDQNINVKNCIIYGNSVSQIQLETDFSNPYFDYCNIEGGLSSFIGGGAGNNYNTDNYTNNIDSNPLFVNPTAGGGISYDGANANWQLLSTSSCVNAGDTIGISILMPDLDLAENPRYNAIIDIGAYEYFFNPSLDLKIFLEGSFVETIESMNSELHAGGLLPLSHPYNTEPWNYTGSETVTTIPFDVVDWVLVELREAASAEQAIPSTRINGWPRAMFVKSDGSVVDLDGNQLAILLPQVTNDLYIVIKHRNHIGVMSSDPLVLSGNTYFYDFTDSVTKAYGGNTGYKEIAPGIFGMVAGDGDADGSVYMSDRTVWRNSLGVVSSYESSDYDMDGNSFMSDRTLWRGNLGVTNPLSQSVSAPLYKSQVPEDN